MHNSLLSVDISDVIMPLATMLDGGGGAFWNRPVQPSVRSWWPLYLLYYGQISLKHYANDAKNITQMMPM